MKLVDFDDVLGIVIADSVYDIPEYIEYFFKRFGKDADLKQVAFFYMDNRDLIVMIKNHPRYELYKDLIPAYLAEEAGPNREEVKAEAKTRGDKAFYNAFLVLDDIIDRRKHLHERLLASVE